MYAQVVKWGVLPVMGGILDQPAGLLRDLRAIEDAIVLAQEQQPPKPASGGGVDMTKPAELPNVKRLGQR